MKNTLIFLLGLITFASCHKADRDNFNFEQYKESHIANGKWENDKCVIRFSGDSVIKTIGTATISATYKHIKGDTFTVTPIGDKSYRVVVTMRIYTYPNCPSNVNDSLYYTPEPFTTSEWYIKTKR